MGRARQAVRSETGKMSRAFGSLTDRTAMLSRQLFSLRTATMAAVGAGGLALLVRKSISTADQIGKTADKLGVGVEALQELRHAAERAGIPLQTFDMAIQRFARRAAEAAQGTGEAKDALKALGITLTDANGQLRPAEDLLGAVADAFTRIEDPAQRLRIAFKLFDSEGVAMVNMLRDGAAGIDRMRERARALGIVISEDMVRRAEKANDQLDDMADVFKVAGTNLALEFMPVLQELARIMTDPAFINGIKDMGQEMKAALQWAVDNQDSIVRVLGAISGFLLGARLGPKGAIAGGLAGAFGPELMGLLDALGIGPAQAKAAAGMGGDAPVSLPTIDVKKVSPAGAPLTFGSAGDETAKKAIDNLKQELSLVTATNEQRHLANALKAAGVDLDSRQGQQIATLVGEIERQSQAMRSLDAVTQTVAFSMESAFDEFIETGTVNFREMVNSMIKDLARLAFRMAVIEPLMKSVMGGFGGIISGGKLPGFARGGSFQVGGSGGLDSQVVAMRLTPGEMVHVSKGGEGRGGSSIIAPVTVNLDARGADRDALERAVARIETEIPSRAVQAVKDAQSRRVL